MSSGKQALARVIAQLADAARGIEEPEGAQELADAIWADFRSAVAGAQAELRDAEAEGVRHWQEARHSG
jgi:hypothetical protein